MRTLMTTAHLVGYDFYLLLNDDTFLYRESVRNLLNEYQQLKITYGDKLVIVGSIEDPFTKVHSYGGLRIISSWNRLKLEKIHPSNKSSEVDTFNGNCVFLPKIILDTVGVIDKVFTHSMGDYDYGFRIKKNSGRIFIGPGYFGECELNLYNIKNINLSIINKIKFILGPKGLPPREWFIFTKRYAGILWYLNFFQPYIKSLISILFIRGKIK